MSVKFDELKPENKEKYLAKAKIAWDMLVTYAQKKKTDTYGLFGNKIGVGKHQVAPYVLYHIREYCNKNKLPLLNCLIIRADGKPGKNWTKNQKNIFKQELKKVVDFDWSKRNNPFLNIKGVQR